MISRISRSAHKMARTRSYIEKILDYVILCRASGWWVLDSLNFILIAVHNYASHRPKLIFEMQEFSVRILSSP